MPTANIILNGETLNLPPFKSRDKSKTHSFSPIQHPARSASQYNVIAVYKVNKEKCVFLHTTNEQLETEFLKDVINSSSPLKVILMYKSNKNAQNLFAENYETLMKEGKDYLNK